MPTEHTIVTATRAATGAVLPDGSIHETRLTDLTQHALDDVRRRLELQQLPFRPSVIVVDVRVTAFAPASEGAS